VTVGRGVHPDLVGIDVFLSKTRAGGQQGERGQCRHSKKQLLHFSIPLSWKIHFSALGQLAIL
jgi:hypothetical protein